MMNCFESLCIIAKAFKTYKKVFSLVQPQPPELIPHLFRTEYTRITAVLSKLFGFEHIEIAEDIASDTFLLASETWGFKGLPENPVAWLYTVAKNKARNYLKHNAVFTQKVAQHIKYTNSEVEDIDIDLSQKNIVDSQLQMMFAICHPAIPPEAQIGLALRVLCGFGIDEIANAFLSNKETINKRLSRAKEKLREEKVKIEFPGDAEIDKRLETVLTVLYLLFNEGYYSPGQNTTLRKDLCLEAMRLAHMLITANALANKSPVYALLALMSFQASRFEARTGKDGATVLYHDQDTALWDKQLITQGEYFLNMSSQGTALSKYHIEAGIAYWHTIKEDTKEKWAQILSLYNRLLFIEYSPIAALNRTFALSKANGKREAIIEAEKLQLTDNHLYHTLLGELYTGIDNAKATAHLQNALALARSAADKTVISNKLKAISLEDEPGQPIQG